MALIEVSDIFGLGKIANSPAVTRITEAIISGVGAAAAPALARRRTKAQVETLDSLRSALGPGEAGKLTLAERAHLQIEQLQAREQENREAVAVEAIWALGELDLTKTSLEPLDPTWLNVFWAYASRISTAELREAWGRLLARQSAGEDFSLRTLQTLQVLSVGEALVINDLAPFVITTRMSDDVVHAGIINRIEMYAFEHEQRIRYNMATNSLVSLPRCGLADDILGPIGIYIESGWAWEAYSQVSDGEARFTIGGRELRIGGEYLSNARVLRIGCGARLSNTGKAIFGLPSSKADEAFVSAVSTEAERLGCVVEG